MGRKLGSGSYGVVHHGVVRVDGEEVQVVSDQASRAVERGGTRAGRRRVGLACAERLGRVQLRCMRGVRRLQRLSRAPAVLASRPLALIRTDGAERLGGVLPLQGGARALRPRALRSLTSPYAAPIPHTQVMKHSRRRVEDADEFASAELHMNRQLARAGVKGVAPFMGHADVDASQQQGAKREGMWLVWRYEGERSLDGAMRQRTFPRNVAGTVLGDARAAELLEGDTSGRELELTTLRALSRQLFEATSQLHANGLVHRDLKPQNLLLADQPTVPGAPALKLCDLGACADLRTGTNWAPEETILDPAYAPPEKYVLPTNSWDKQHLVGPLVWAANAPDRFDSFSAGLVVMQMCVPSLRNRGKFLAFRRALEQQDFDLDAWRETRNRQQIKELWALDADSGAGWELVKALLIERNVETSAAALAGRQRPSATEAIARFPFLAETGIRAVTPPPLKAEKNANASVSAASKKKAPAAVKKPAPAAKPAVQRRAASGGAAFAKARQDAPPRRVMARRPGGGSRAGTRRDPLLSSAPPAADEASGAAEPVRRGTARMSAVEGAAGAAQLAAEDLAQAVQSGALTSSVSNAADAGLRAAKDVAGAAERAAGSLAELVAALPQPPSGLSVGRVNAVRRSMRRSSLGLPMKGAEDGLDAAKGTGMDANDAALAGHGVVSDEQSSESDAACVRKGDIEEAMAEAQDVAARRAAAAAAAAPTLEQRHRKSAAMDDVYARLSKMESSLERMEKLAGGSGRVSPKARADELLASLKAEPARPTATESALERLEQELAVTDALSSRGADAAAVEGDDGTVMRVVEATTEATVASHVEKAEEADINIAKVPTEADLEVVAETDITIVDADAETDIEDADEADIAAAEGAEIVAGETEGAVDLEVSYVSFGMVDDDFEADTDEEEEDEEDAPEAAGMAVPHASYRPGVSAPLPGSPDGAIADSHAYSARVPRGALPEGTRVRRIAGTNTFVGVLPDGRQVNVLPDDQASETVQAETT